MASENSGVETGTIVKIDTKNGDGEQVEIPFTRESNFLLWIPVSTDGFFEGFRIDNSMMNDLGTLSLVSKKLIIRFERGC